MLVELNIDNFAIIDHLRLNLQPGLIAFTGETGAGKSIIIDALETLLGGRADANLVRSGSERASVEGIFSIPPSLREPVHAILEKEELMDNPDWVTLAREIRTNGRNIARVNGRSVTTSLLRELGEYLVDVHGQSEHLSLLRVSQHLRLLDRYATSQAQEPASENGNNNSSVETLLATYQATYRKIREVQRQLETLHLSESDAARRVDMLTYQIQEIESSRLRPGEEEELKEERNRLANAEGLSKLAQQALEILDEGTPETASVTDLFGQVVHALTSLARIDAAQAALAAETQEQFEALSELGRSLRLYLESIEFNPRRLDQVEERLALFQTLKRKYGETIPAILEFGERACQELETITHAEERIKELDGECQVLLEQLSQEGRSLSQKRRTAASQLNQAIEKELEDLNMTGARFQVDFQQTEDELGAATSNGRKVAYTLNGIDRVEFLIAPNPGEGFKPLTKIASGGETSRLMLALKNVLAQADEIPSLVFDEIDQGIGGRVGSIVGEKLWSLARRHQVLCITHLPQLAVFSEQHFGVEKQVGAGRTATVVRSLEGQDRLVELAQMMGDVSEGTLKSARELVLMASERTTAPSKKK
jgi:DNA repair protein RecN (Recombination protein N)